MRVDLHENPVDAYWAVDWTADSAVAGLLGGEPYEQIIGVAIQSNHVF